MKTMGLLTRRKLFTPQRGMMSAGAGGLPPFNYVSFSEDPTKFASLVGGTGAGIPRNFADGAGIASTSRQLLPDVPGGGAGVGFTCTGLTKDPGGDWWIGNFGAQQGNGGGANPPTSIVRVSPDGSTYVTQVILTQAVGGLQGVTYIPTGNGWLAYVDGASSRICFVDRTGAIPRTPLNLSFAPNALVWDDVRQGLWAGNNSNGDVWLVTLAGAIIGYADFNNWPGTLDHLSIDTTTGLLWALTGANGSPGKLVAWDLTRDRFVNSWLLNDAMAPEGLYVNGATITMVSDGHYHATGSAPNTVAPNDVNDFQVYATPAVTDRRHSRVYKANDLLGPYGRQAYHMLIDRGAGNTSADFTIFTRNGDATINGLSANIAWSGKTAIPGTPQNLGMRLLNGVMTSKTFGDTYSRQVFAATYANGANDIQLGTRGTMTPDNIVDVIGSALALNKGAVGVAYRPRLGA